jgi:hypothetical protein
MIALYNGIWHLKMPFSENSDERLDPDIGGAFFPNDKPSLR